MKSVGFDSSNAAVAVTTVPHGGDGKPEVPGQAYIEYTQAQRTAAANALGDKADLLAADESMLRIKDVIGQIASASVPVLITGESGVGKEVIARCIHQASPRHNKPFVAINCAALPSNLLESELFGFEKGSFTGAHQRHAGKFEQAHGGTLLLDEVTEMDPSLQAKLLRALQEREIERIGGNGPIPVDVRVVATTNRDIFAAVANGTFRQDLFYRLHVVRIEVPALRHRQKDVDMLSAHFLQSYAREYGKTAMSFAPQAIEALKAYNWPGNVRELQNVVQRAVILAKSDVITVEDLPIDVNGQSAPTNKNWVEALPIGRQLAEVETQFILETLRYHSGNRTHAAKTLGISLRTLRNKINEFTAAGFEVTAPLTGRAQ